MEKVKCERRYVPDGTYIMGYLVPVGKANKSAITIIAAYTVEEAIRKLDVAVADMPPKMRAKYDW